MEGTTKLSAELFEDMPTRLFPEEETPTTWLDRLTSYRDQVVEFVHSDMSMKTKVCAAWTAFVASPLDDVIVFAALVPVVGFQGALIVALSLEVSAVGLLAITGGADLKSIRGDH